MTTSESPGQLGDPIPAATDVETYIRDGLADGSLRPGARLPTERAFAELLGVSRASVRRALAEQEALGVVIRHQGRGTFIATDPQRQPLPDLDGDSGSAWADTSPSEVMVVRSIVEPQIAFLAAQSASQRDLERMEHCLDEAVSAPSYEEFEVWDGAYHRAIAAAAHNRFLLSIFDHVNTVRSELRWGQLKRRSLTPERRRAYESEHGAILGAIRDRDASRARDLMSDHLRHVRDNMLHPDRGPNSS